jgi:anti-sigma factor RsiW
MRSVHSGNTECTQALALLDPYLSSELTAESTIQTNGHLETCVRCREEFRVREHIMLRLQTAVSRSALPAGLERRISRSLRRSVGFGISRLFE